MKLVFGNATVITRCYWIYSREINIALGLASLPASATLMQFVVSCDFFIGDMGRVSCGKNLAVKKLKSSRISGRVYGTFVRQKFRSVVRDLTARKTRSPLSREKKGANKFFDRFSRVPWNPSYSHLIPTTSI